MGAPTAQTEQQAGTAGDLSEQTPVRPAPCTISCVIPCHNEENGLAALIDELAAVMPDDCTPEFVLVDDGSTDGTWASMARLKAPRGHMKRLRLSRNFGKEAALSAGMSEASGDAVIPVDADGQHPPELIPQFIRSWRAGRDVVYGVRQTRPSQSLVQRALTRQFYRLQRAMSPLEIPADAGDFRLMDRRVVDVLNAMPEQNRYMKGLYAWAGFSCEAIPFEERSRGHGTSHFNLRRSVLLAMDGIYNFTSLPLRLWGPLGFIILASAFVLILVTIFRKLVMGIDADGFATLFISILFLGGVQIFAIGMIGEYVARIFDDVKRRPLYVIAEQHKDSAQDEA